MNEPVLYLDADVVTMNPGQPSARAFLVADGRLLAVGEEEEIKNRLGSVARVVNLGGRTVLPGFIETHNHLSMYALTLGMLDASAHANPTLADLKDRLAATAAQTPAGQWIVGWGYDDTLIRECRHLNRQDLDEIAPEHPVFIIHISAHLGYVNSRALRIAGVHRHTPQPAGGEIHLDQHGDPSGLLLEPGAMMLVAAHLPAFDQRVFDLLLPSAVEHFNQTGITSVHDGGIGALGHGPAVIRSYRGLEKTGRLGVRVYLTILHDLYDQFSALGLGDGFGSEFVKIGAVKLFQDGSIQGLTAALSQDYFRRPGFRGWTIWTQQALDDLARKYHDQGLQIALHANGDAAIESVITALERAQAGHRRDDHRHMIIHCQMCTDDHVRRMKNLGVIPSYLINHVYYWGDRHVAKFIGPERAARIDPLASTAREGLRFTLHADTPVTPISPLASMHNAVNRLTRNGEVLGPAERITPLAALRAYTSDAAYCSFEEEIKGRLAPGLLADFVVLSDNPTKIEPKGIRDIRVLQTVVGGRTVFSSTT